MNFREYLKESELNEVYKNIKIDKESFFNYHDLEENEFTVKYSNATEGAFGKSLLKMLMSNKPLTSKYESYNLKPIDYKSRVSQDTRFSIKAKASDISMRVSFTPGEMVDIWTITRTS